MIAPKEGWHEFKDEAEQLDYMKSIKLIPKTKGLRPIYYTGIYVDLIAECDVVGYVDNYTTVISIDGKLHCIHPDFLLEMQSSPTTKKYKDTHRTEVNAMNLFDFVTIDFETANSSMNSACSVGIIAVKDLEVVEKFSVLINPNGASFSETNMGIHGITPEMVRDAKTLDELMPEIGHYFDRHVPVIAHNAHFDMSVLRQSTTATIPEFYYADSIYIAEPFVSGSKSLVNCAASLGVNVEHHHDAADDALVCAQICIEAFKSSGCVTAWEFFALNGTALYNFAELKPMKTFSHGSKGKVKKQVFSHNKLNLSSLAPYGEIDTSNPLFGKSIVFTGELSMERSEAAQLAVNCGALVKSSVSSKTDYLVVGVQDKALVGEDGLSTKEEKAYQLNAEGKGHVCFLNEEQFLDLAKTAAHV